MNMKVTIDIPKSVLLKVIALSDAYDEIGEEKVNSFLHLKMLMQPLITI